MRGRHTNWYAAETGELTESGLCLIQANFTAIFLALYHKLMICFNNNSMIHCYQRPII